jgi:hypothetical protein
MGLNKTEGEFLGSIGRGKPVPVQKWAERFQMLEVASNEAAQAFIKLGAARPIKFTESNILVMEYHLLDQVIWVFWMPIKGIDRYYNYTFTLGKQVMADLAMAGEWPAIHAAPPNIRAN